MKRALTLFLFCTLLVFSLFLSCGKPDDTPDDPKTEDNRPEYTVTFVFYTERMTKTFKEGDAIVPPEFAPYETADYYVVFKGWEEEFRPVTENTTYKALYEFEYKTYNATFVMGDTVKTEKVSFSAAAIAPEDVPDYKGMKFMGWDKPITTGVEDVTYTAIYCDTNLLPTTSLNYAYKQNLMKYEAIEGGAADGKGQLRRAQAFYTLALHEHRNPQGGAIAQRVVEHMTSLVTKDQAPPIDAGTNWANNPMIAGIAFARVTPTIWNIVPPDIQMRINTLMCAMIYLESFATSDYNQYKTGPGMYGNFSKDWNPNYRLGNVPIMVYATYFFGVGDMEKGAEIVNTYIKGFDETAYTDLVNTFQKYGWRRAFKRWTTEGRTSTDGKNVVGLSAKELLINGGQAVGEDTSTASDLLVALGTGTGVANRDPKTKKGRDYLYKTFSLYEPEKIVQHLLNYNYGAVSFIPNSYEATEYRTVVSNHFYDIDKDGTKDLVAWILDDTSSPYEGEEGMMTEFASGNRSSTGYCTHDFILTTVLISATANMELYTTDENGIRVAKTNEDGSSVYLFDVTAPENADIFHRIQIGNEDLIYKLVHGYQCYATGSYGVSSKTEREGSSWEYLITKTMWRTYFLSRGTVAPAESFNT
ncbi:MAG: hypothetical protein IKC72_02430 [Clostridia bacterium]|nr:hypothetical protein [Clostridia bacterium]